MCSVCGEHSNQIFRKGMEAVYSSIACIWAWSGMHRMVCVSLHGYIYDTSPLRMFLEYTQVGGSHSGKNGLKKCFHIHFAYYNGVKKFRK